MPKITDIYGEYEPILNKSGCIDKRTLTNLDHSLRILYSEFFPKEPDSTRDLVLKRTESLQDVVNYRTL